MCQCDDATQTAQWRAWEARAREWVRNVTCSTLRSMSTLHAVRWTDGIEGLARAPDDTTVQCNSDAFMAGAVWASATQRDPQRFRWEIATVSSLDPLKFRKTGTGCTARGIETLEVRARVSD